MKKHLLTLLMALLALTMMVGCQQAPPATPTPSPEAVEATPEEVAATTEPAETEEVSAAVTPTEAAEDATPTEDATEKASTVVVEITMADGGIIELTLDRDAAPITVDNFVALAKDGFYDGLTYHRIVPGFVIQGGDPDGNGMGGPDHRIKGEFARNGWENHLSHERGVISMARSQDPDSAGSQFFIVLDDAAIPSLDGGYAAFGKVTKGMDVVDAIATVKTTGEKPAEPVVMESVRVIESK